MDPFNTPFIDASIAGTLFTLVLSSILSIDLALELSTGRTGVDELQTDLPAVMVFEAAPLL